MQRYTTQGNIPAIISKKPLQIVSKVGYTKAETRKDFGFCHEEEKTKHYYTALTGYTISHQSYTAFFAQENDTAHLEFHVLLAGICRRSA